MAILNTRRKNKKMIGGGSLKTSYGYVILPKGTLLYHLSIKNLCDLPVSSLKPVLFTTLHPSEWYIEDGFISTIELQRDVTLLFMIKIIRNLRIFSALPDLLSEKNTNLAKMNYRKIKTWLPKLESHGLDGWITSIENKGAIEFAILNNKDTLKIISCDPLDFNWANSTYNKDDKLIPKNWGEKYPISSLTKPFSFFLPIQYKSQLEKYISQINEEDPRSTAFSIILENAILEYFEEPFENIKLKN